MTTATPETRPYTILLVEDSPAQQALTRRALEDSSVQARLFVVDDGVDALKYLRHEDGFAEPATSPRPDIILLDLNMPRMDGYTVLKHLKADPALAAIPVTVLTTSQSDADARECYASGANAFVPKPAEYDKFVQLFNALAMFWAHFVKLPSEPSP